MIGRVGAGLAVLFGIACAATPRGPGGYVFPESFEVNQVVEVDPGRPGSKEFLASLRRTNEDYEVTLFDVVLQIPVLTASVRAGAVSVQVMTEGMESKYGYRLVELLPDLYGRVFPNTVEGTTESNTEAFGVRLAGVPESGSLCRFPSTIEVIPHRSVGPRLLVRTIDVTCAPGQRRL